MFEQKLHFVKKLSAKLKSEDLIALLAILISGLVVLQWFNGNFFIYFWDSSFPFNPPVNLYQALFVWESQHGTGVANPCAMTSLPYFFIIFMLNKVFPLQLSQLLLLYTLFTGSGITMYYVVREINQKQRIHGLASALFYMFNMYVVGHFIPFVSYFFLMAFLPLMLLLLKRGLHASWKNRTPSMWYILLFQIPLILSVPTLTFLLFHTTFFLFAYLLFFLITHGLDRGRAIGVSKFVALLLITSFAFNAWWILPEFSFASQISYGLAQILSSNVQGGAYVNLSILNVIRLLGTVGLYSRHPFPSFSWPSLYTGGSSLFTLLSFLAPIVICIPFLSKKGVRRDRHLFFFGFMFLIYVLLVAGMGIFPYIFLWLSEHFWPIILFIVNPYLASGLMLTFCYAYLFGFGLDAIFSRMWGGESFVRGFDRCRSTHMTGRLFSRKVLASLVCILILFSVVGVFAFPVWTGELVPTNIPARVQIPAYYQEVAQFFLNQRGHYKILSLPMDGPLQASQWYVGIDVLRWQTGIPTISTRVTLPSDTSLIYEKLNSLIYQSDTAMYSKILATLNVKYIVVRNDAVPGLGPGFNLTQIREFLKGQTNISFIKSFGKLDLYENLNFLPVIYAGERLIDLSPMKSDIERYDPVANFMLSEHFDPKRDIIITSAPSNSLVFPEETDPRVITDDGQSSFWRARAVGRPPGFVGMPVLFDDAETKVKDTDSLKIEIPSGTAATVGVDHEYEPAENWSGKDFISFYWHGANTGIRFYVKAFSGDANFFTNIFIDNFAGWRQLIFPLGTFTYLTVGSPNWNNITRIEIGNESGMPSPPYTYHLDRIIADVYPAIVDMRIPEGLTFYVINPTEYLVEVKQARGAFVLVVNQAFDPGWKLLINGEQVSENLHYEVNGYANAWYINQTGSFSIFIQYVPQKFVYVGAWISIISVSITLCMLTIIFFTAYRKSKHPIAKR